MFITCSGREIDIERIKKEDICLEDIAHHLTKTCRYAGALPLDIHYSVAKHSIELTKHAHRQGYDREFLKALLLHDAPETYLGDIQSSLKRLLPDYLNLEKQVTAIIQDKYNLSTNPFVHLAISCLDKTIVLDEAKTFFPKRYYPSFKKTAIKNTEPLNTEPLGICLDMNENLFETYETFLTMCYELEIRDE